MDSLTDTILAVVGAFLILSIALLLWIANLLAQIERLERELRKAHAWHESWTGVARRRERY